MSPERKFSPEQDYIELVPFLPGVLAETDMRELISPELNQRLIEAGLEPAQRAQVTSALNHAKNGGLETVGEFRKFVSGLDKEDAIYRLVDLERGGIQLGSRRAEILFRLLVPPASLAEERVYLLPASFASG